MGQSRARPAAGRRKTGGSAWVQELYASAPGAAGAKRLAEEQAVCRWASSPAAVQSTAAGGGGTAAQVLGRLYRDMAQADRTAEDYPGRRIHDSLRPWYLYLGDGGHSIAGAVTSLYRPGADPDEFIAALPVKTVQRLGWHLSTLEGITDPVPFVNIGYDPQTGTRFPDADEEL